MDKKFKGQFDALMKMGAAYQNGQRFHALHGKGKPLWEFKEHDHRLYCCRKVLTAAIVEVVLLSGWIKQKEGKTDKENREIEKAVTLYTEMMGERGCA
jgi:hypothetical protein